MKKINVLVTEPLEFGIMVQKVEIGDYKDYYKLGGFENFDVVRVEWDGHEISLYVDDEGLLKSGNFGREVVGYPEPLFGTIIVTGGVDTKGNTLSIPEEINILDIPKYISDVKYVIGQGEE